MSKYTFMVTYHTEDRLLFNIKTKSMCCECSSSIRAVEYACNWVRNDFNFDDSVARVLWRAAEIDIRAEFWEHPNSRVAQIWLRPKDLWD